MSAADVQLKILEPMQRVYIPPRKMEPADEMAALRDYVEALQQFESSDLSYAWGRVRETHVKREWPQIGIFYKFANENRHDRNEVSGASRRHGNEPSSQELWERWKAVSRTLLAQEAVRRGVAWTLKCAILYDKKLPEQCDLREFTAAKESAARTKAKIEAGEKVVFKGRLLAPFTASNKELALKMYHNLQMNETRTQAEINHGVRDYADAAE